jgi:hypothetical protein
MAKGLPQVQKFQLGTNADGTPHYHYYAPGAHVVVTGPITGTVDTEDGTTYDVTENVIAVHPEHAAQVGDMIGLRYEMEGHPSHTDPEVPFTFTPVTPHGKKLAKAARAAAGKDES